MMATVFVAIPALAEEPWKSLIEIDDTEVVTPGVERVEGSYIKVKLAHSGYNDIDGSIKGNQKFLLIYHSGRSARSTGSLEFQSYEAQILKFSQFQEYNLQPSAGYFGFFRIKLPVWKIMWDLTCPETGQVRNYCVSPDGDGIKMSYTQDNFEVTDE
jgi:hypothetical protein